MAAPSKEAQRGPNVNQHKRLAQGVNVGKVGGSSAKSAPKPAASKSKGGK